MFGKQLADVIEWTDFREDDIFWKWKNSEIKKGSRLILRAGQDAIFISNGRVEGIFKEEGSYDVESEIVPFLSTLKGFKFGFNSGLRVEILFVNTRDITCRWGTKNPISIPAKGLPGGMPIRAFGNYIIRVSDAMKLIDRIAGIQDSFSAENVSERVSGILDSLLMKWIVAKGQDMFNLQANSAEIGLGIRGDLNQELEPLGLSCEDFTCSSFSYPEEVARMQNKAAGQAMVADRNAYMQMAAADGMSKGDGGNLTGAMVQAAFGAQMAGQMFQGQTSAAKAGTAQTGDAAGAGTARSTDAAGQSGQGVHFCPNCGAKVSAGQKFCANCGAKLPDTI